MKKFRLNMLSAAASTAAFLGFFRFKTYFFPRMMLTNRLVRLISARITMRPASQLHCHFSAASCASQLSSEKQIEFLVDLCSVDSKTLNPAAVGWSRQPLHRCDLGAATGRNKRWEYWCVQGPHFAFAATVSDIDYLALHSVWFTDFANVSLEDARMLPLGLGGKSILPTRCGGPAAGQAGDLSVKIDPTTTGIRLRAQSPRVSADISISRPAGHECLGVVIPWSSSRFQYTVKENALPAQGTVTVDGRPYAVQPHNCYAVLDHGRGRWNYNTEWNWGSGSGRLPDGRLLGIQLGGKWTDGTGMNENALCVGGRLHKLRDVRWEYDSDDWMAPWRVCDAGADADAVTNSSSAVPFASAGATGSSRRRVNLTFTPRYERAVRTNALLLANETHQMFGSWSGTVVTDEGEEIAVRELQGFAEEVRMRW